MIMFCVMWEKSLRLKGELKLPYGLLCAEIPVTTIPVSAFVL